MVWKWSSEGAGRHGGETATVPHANSNRPQWLEADRGAACCLLSSGSVKDGRTGWFLPVALGRSESVSAAAAADAAAGTSL